MSHAKTSVFTYQKPCFFVGENQVFDGLWGPWYIINFPKNPYGLSMGVGVGPSPPFHAGGKGPGSHTLCVANRAQILRETYNTEW